MPKETANSPTGNWRAVLAVVLLLVILAPVAYSIFARATATAAETPEAPDAMYTECIQKTEDMRFHHWELLKGMREKVVRDGIRGDLVEVETSSQGKIKVERSLDGCWRCHQSKVRFCDRCHNAASVRPDCFGCHYYPDVDEIVLER